MTLVHKEFQVILMIDYMPYEKAISGDYHAGLIRKLHNVIKEKLQRMLTKDVFLQQGNAPVHKANIIKAAVPVCGFE